MGHANACLVRAPGALSPAPLSRTRCLARPSCPTATSSLHRRGDRDRGPRDSPSLQARASRARFASVSGTKKGGLFCLRGLHARRSTKLLGRVGETAPDVCPVLPAQRPGFVYFAFIFFFFLSRLFPSERWPPPLLRSCSLAQKPPSSSPLTSLYTPSPSSRFFSLPPYFIRNRSCSMETRMAKPTPAVSILHLAFKAARRRRRVPRSSQARST
jgi:hypothetical protein